MGKTPVNKSVKYLNFGQKLQIQPIRLLTQTLEFTKEPYYVLPPEGTQQNGTSSWTIMIQNT